MSFSLHDVGLEGKAFFSTEWKPDTREMLPHVATMVGGVPSTNHGCLLRVNVVAGAPSLDAVQGLMIRIVFRRGVNAPMYRFIGALSVIPANALVDVSVQGAARLFAHLAHTLPQEVVLQIVEYFLPRASASDQPPKSGIDHPVAHQFSPWTAPSSSNRKSGATGGFGFGNSSSFTPKPWAGSETKPAAPVWGGVAPAPAERQQGTSRRFAGFGNKSAPNAKQNEGKAPLEDPSQPFVTRPSDPVMLALPCLKSLPIASYVSAPEVLAVPKWCLGPQSQRDAIVGNPMPEGSNFFTAAGYHILLSALAATGDGLGMRYAGSMALTPNVELGMSLIVGTSRKKAVEEFMGSYVAAPDYYGYELRAATSGGNTVDITLPLDQVEGPLLLLHNCCQDDLKTTLSGSPPSLVQANRAAEIDGEALTGLSNVPGNVSCHWLVPKNTTMGRLQLRFAVAAQRTLALRLLTPRCWKRLVGGGFPAPPTSLEPGKPALVELPPAGIYQLAGVNPRTFNPNLTLTATALFSDKSVGEPVSGVVGHAFTAAELLGSRSADEMVGVTVRMEYVDVQMMTMSNGQFTLPLFGLCGLRAQTCITRAMFDDRQKDDGFKTVVHLLAHCETESYADQVLLCTSSAERVQWGMHGATHQCEFDAATAVNAVIRSATFVNFNVNNTRSHKLGGGWGASPPAPALPATPYECLLVEARVLAGPTIDSTPLRIKELMIFLANKDGVDQKIDDFFGPSSCK